MPASRRQMDQAAAVWRSWSQSGDPSVSGSTRYVRSIAPSAMARAQDRDTLPALLTTGRPPRRGVQKSNLVKYAAPWPGRLAPGSSLRRAPADIPDKRGVDAVSGPRPARSAWKEPLIAAPDRRRLVDDFAHRRGALLGSFQVLEDYRQRGRSAVLLNRESGTGNKARSHVDVLDLPDSPNHSIAPSSRPVPAWPRCVAVRAQSVISSGSQAVMPWIEAEVLGLVSNVAALAEPRHPVGRWPMG